MPTPKGPAITDQTPGLVVCDMDGTLLTDNHELPDGFGAILDRVHAAGGHFVPASGRQFATLSGMFDGYGLKDFICENGTVVCVDGHVGATEGAAIPRELVLRVIGAVRDSGLNLGLVVCCPDTAYVERADGGFHDEVAVYYVANTRLADLTTVGDAPVKLAIYDFDDAEAGAFPLLRDAVGDQLEVALSGAHWVDVMMPGVNKGTAVDLLRERLGIGRDRTAVFGDYLNDLSMMGCGDLSYAMANAHPVITAAANRTAPSNNDAGVLTVLDELFP